MLKDWLSRYSETQTRPFTLPQVVLTSLEATQETASLSPGALKTPF